ncbi:BQ5605_C016g08053 [Microbotryum silenes-dioicae]|uniref:BQ5605_C016g08053 protein n=1 Tax=Microbotryum silenes-dioicae TaxID=796604 RepID=A0A2X0LZ34_9BASI|nr:BQ5605_C016g08053 [Microbotryum silenes-dioicae]
MALVQTFPAGVVMRLLLEMTTYAYLVDNVVVECGGKDALRRSAKSADVGALVVVDALKARFFLDGMFNLTSIHRELLFVFDNLIVQGLRFHLPSSTKEIFPEICDHDPLALPFMEDKEASAVEVLDDSCDAHRDNASIRYSACFLLASGCFALVSNCNTWSAISTTSDTARAGAITMTVLGGGLLSTWTYLPQGQMDHILDGKSPKEMARLGTRHPGFTYRH